MSVGRGRTRLAGSLRGTKQVRPQFSAWNASSAFNLNNAVCRNALPLVNRLTGYPQLGRELGHTANFLSGVTEDVGA